MLFLRFQVPVFFDPMLVPPNGDIFIYKIMVNTFLTDVSLHLFFYNHAYVSGDYIIIAHIFLAQLGNYYTNCYVVFDPPRDWYHCYSCYRNTILV